MMVYDEHMAQVYISTCAPAVIHYSLWKMLNFGIKSKTKQTHSSAKTECKVNYLCKVI